MDKVSRTLFWYNTARTPLGSTTMEQREMPRPQSSFTNIDKIGVEVHTFMLKRLLDGVDLNPETVKTVTDLYCGNGVLVAGEIGYFPHATIHAIDVYDDILAPYVQKNRRVQFHQGWVSDLLAARTIPQSDFVSISFASRHHGLDALGVQFLKKIVGGYLLTIGDNGGLEEESYFQDAFQRVKSIPRDFATIWKAK